MILTQPRYGISGKRYGSFADKTDNNSQTLPVISGLGYLHTNFGNIFMKEGSVILTAAGPVYQDNGNREYKSNSNDLINLSEIVY